MPLQSPKSDQAHREAGAAQRRRLTRLGALLGVAGAIVAIAIAVSSSGGEDAGTAGGGVAGEQEVARVLDGIPQKGLVLGRPDAPVTMVEFIDPQCPYCRDFAVGEMPALVDKYVRTGKVRVELRTLSFVGPDSVTAAKAIQAAALQNKAWNVSDVLFHNQGRENSGYVTDEFLRRTLGAVDGLDVDRALRAAKQPAAAEELGAANTLARRYAADSTPSFALGRTGGDLVKAEVEPTASALGAKLDELLTKSGT